MVLSSTKTVQSYREIGRETGFQCEQICLMSVDSAGPLPNTMSDFWRMVWERKTLVIVMTTRFGYCLSFYLVCLSVCLSVCQFVSLSVCVCLFVRQGTFYFSTSLLLT